ncbi:MAG: hypothetical protein ACTH31_16925, partial [Pseudoclavibacter sp.]
DIDEPTLLVTRLDVGETIGDDFDRELASFLDDPNAYGQSEEAGEATSKDVSADGVATPDDESADTATGDLDTEADADTDSGTDTSARGKTDDEQDDDTTAQ